MRKTRIEADREHKKELLEIIRKGVTIGHKYSNAPRKLIKSLEDEDTITFPKTGQVFTKQQALDQLPPDAPEQISEPIPYQVHGEFEVSAFNFREYTAVIEANGKHFKVSTASLSPEDRKTLESSTADDSRKEDDLPKAFCNVVFRLSADTGKYESGFIMSLDKAYPAGQAIKDFIDKILQPNPCSQSR